MTSVFINRNFTIKECMGTSKNELFSPEVNEMAKMAKAMGHPARIAILQHLAKTKGCFCGDLVDVLPLSQSTVSQHLKTLKEAGIIKGNIEGTSICYCINTKNWNRLNKILGQLFKEIKKCC